MPENLKSGHQRQDCTIIILSFNTREVTDTCLTNVRRSGEYYRKTTGNIIKTVVVDNGSKDGSVQLIRHKYPEVKIMALPENIGYSRANNMALKKVRTPFILLLNSDAYLRKDTLVKAFAYMDQNRTCDGLCIRLVYPDGGFQAYGGNLPTPARTALWALGIESLPIIKQLIRPIYQYDRKFFTREQQMEWCSTGFFLIRKKVYDLTGGFDGNLFLYMEDVEWCKRIKDRKLKIFYTPGIDIVHLGGFTSHKLTAGILLARHIGGILHYHKIHYPGSLNRLKTFLKLGMIIRAFFYNISGKTGLAKVYSGVKI